MYTLIVLQSIHTVLKIQSYTFKAMDMDSLPKLVGKLSQAIQSVPVYMKRKQICRSLTPCTTVFCLYLYIYQVMTKYKCKYMKNMFM